MVDAVLLALILFFVLRNGQEGASASRPELPKFRNGRRPF